MGLNRLIDAELDARNPRTATRELPSGRAHAVPGGVSVRVALALFLVAVFQLDPVVRWLWPIPVALFVAYPYLKRFTWLCHLWLGAVHSGSHRWAPGSRSQARRRGRPGRCLPPGPLGGRVRPLLLRSSTSITIVRGAAVVGHPLGRATGVFAGARAFHLRAVGAAGSGRRRVCRSGCATGSACSPSQALLLYEHRSSARATCAGSTRRSSPSTASSASSSSSFVLIETLS